MFADFVEITSLSQINTTRPFITAINRINVISLRVSDNTLIVRAIADSMEVHWSEYYFISHEDALNAYNLIKDGKRT